MSQFRLITTAALCSVSHSRENIGEIVRDPSYHGMMKQLIYIARQLVERAEAQAKSAGKVLEYEAQLLENERRRGQVYTQMACCSVLSNLSFHEPSRTKFTFTPSA